MRPSENWRSVFLLPQSAKKKKNKTANDSPSLPPQKISLPKAPPQRPQNPRRHTMPDPSPSTAAVQSPDSDVSPKTAVQPGDKTKSDYFSVPSQSQGKEEENKGGDAEHASPSLESTTGSFSAESSRTDPYAGRHRGSSISSLTFAPTRNPSLPQGTQKKTDKQRIRASSPPPPKRFQPHVGFDNLPLGEATKHNTISLTLNYKHKGYQPHRRSRTFMVGLDEHAYSDYALQWLLDGMVDDGDEVVCVRVVEKDIRASDSTAYQAEAQTVMERILECNGANRAIKVVLEYASGKLHSTFQHLIYMYSPAMLIVGTRGRSLGGFQGLVNTRNSFSKYCLQYSPVPVVVVRPTEKREKKKNKRKNDSERQTYVKMLSATGGKHEADSERSSMYEVEIRNTADDEAHQVAQALGLPAVFDPTIKPIDPKSFLHPRQMSAPSILSQTTTAAPSKAPPSAAGDSDEDEDEEEDEDEYEAYSGQQLLNTSNQKEKLHKMEVGEAAALLQQNRKSSLDDDEDDESKESRTSSTS